MYEYNVKSPKKKQIIIEMKMCIFGNGTEMIKIEIGNYIA